MIAISIRLTHHARSITSVLLATALSACGGGQDTGDEDGIGGATAAATGAPPAPPAGSAGGVTADPRNPQLVALGDSIFHGLAAGGTCATCHGQGATGGPIAPSLADAEWLHGDGSFDFIVNTVRSGVPAPKKFPAAMPPMGGAPLSPDQVQAVSAYVHSLGGGHR